MRQSGIGANRIYRGGGKRALDLVVGLVAFGVSLPLQAGSAFVIRVTLGSPIIFAQQRAGLNGRVFTIRKFRTMTDARDSLGDLLPDSDRLTPVGRLLRSSSIDELPQLWNVILGDMSLVGPRPLPARYLPRYSPEQAHRHDVRPGVTGWTAVHGRNAQTWEQKFKSDVWYTQNVSLLLDLRIMLRTVLVVLRHDGVNSVGDVAVPEFLGHTSQKPPSQRRDAPERLANLAASAKSADRR